MVDRDSLVVRKITFTLNGQEVIALQFAFKLRSELVNVNSNRRSSVWLSKLVHDVYSCKLSLIL